MDESNLTKKERWEIENNIKDLGTSWIAKIIEGLALIVAIWVCLSGGDIADITHGVCCAGVACYLRLRRIHDTLSISDLKNELKN